ncbi:MAG: haloacid dehalogenase [Proteobacteria bacterium]|nr:haloacid dehalogenase [Pseudomonadota bacterium]
MNSSDRFFLDAFNINFKIFQDGETPIALYGIGEKTKLLLENIKGFKVVGLMDKDSAKENVYDQPMLSYEEVIEKAKCIIIVANMSVAPLIYRRVKFLKTEHGIDISYINGTIPSEINESVKNTQPCGTTIEDLKKEIDENEIISFDLFDTLIMRKVLLPTDIFDLVERELREKHHLCIDFKGKRIEAEHHCYRHNDKYCTIHDIYNTLRELLHCDNKLIQKIKQIEIETELKYCTLRAAMVQCYEYAKIQHKIVLITTDSFLTRKHVVLLLEKCGIKDFDQLLISCEERKLKYLGDMWQQVSQSYKGRRILHIGDNQLTDIEMAQRCHVNTFKIESAYGLVSNPALSCLCKSARTIDDSVLLGQLAAKFLNDPFILNKNRGCLPIDNPFSLGYLSFGPLVLSYLLWLINKSRQCKIDKLLFFARDGYILNKLYKKMVDYFSIESAEAVYFLTSRRAASVAAIKNEGDIEFIINNLCKTKKIRYQQLLSTALCVFPDSGDPLAEKQCYEINNEDLIAHTISLYKEKILKNSEAECQSYIEYIHSLGLMHGDMIGCVNFVGRGITQSFIANIMEKELTGFYFAKELDMLDVCSPLDKCYSLYDEYVSPHTSRTNLAMKFLFGEIVFSSPDEQLVKFEKNGLPVFEKRELKRDFRKIDECHSGIEQFINDMMVFDDRLLRRVFNNEIVDMLYGLFTSKSCICSEEVREMFYFDDYYNPNVANLRLDIS